jgi:hypothetical protein
MRKTEVVILLLIVAITTGLGIIVVRNLNEARMRSECSGNLRYLGFALHSYQDTFKHFPPGTMSNPKLPSHDRLSWLVELMPFIDGQMELSIDRAQGWRAQVNNRETMGHGTEEEFYPMSMSMLNCPANPSHAIPGKPQLTHYLGVSGIGQDAAALRLDYPGIGIFGYDRSTRLEDIKDERATTLMVMETTQDNGPWLAGGTPTVRGLDPNRPPYLGEGGQFGSHHRRGSHAVFVDASVRFLPDSLDPKIFEAMATIAGGEKVSPFDEE